MGQHEDLKLVEAHDEGVVIYRLDRIRILEDLTRHVPQQKGLARAFYPCSMPRSSGEAHFEYFGGNQYEIESFRQFGDQN
jgi:hypothetical protein